MNDKIIVTLIGSITLLVAVFLHNHLSPYHSCVRSLTGTQIVVGGPGFYTDALAARVCAGRLGGGGGD